MASRELAGVATENKNRWLERCAERILQSEPQLLEANQKDLALAGSMNLTTAEMDRLTLTPQRIVSLSNGLRQIASLRDPIGEVLDDYQGSKGIRIQKVRVPIGVIFFIFESRPNVTADASAICVKSGNAVILRGGKEAAHSSRCLSEMMRECAKEEGLPVDAIQLIDTPDRSIIDGSSRCPTWSIWRFHAAGRA